MEDKNYSPTYQSVALRLCDTVIAPSWSVSNLRARPNKLCLDKNARLGTTEFYSQCSIRELENK